jgi:hypothetical protein
MSVERTSPLRALLSAHTRDVPRGLLVDDPWNATNS